MAVAAMLGGCGTEPEPSTDAVVYYFKAFRVQGRVRRCWPAGQEYVNGVLKACTDLDKKLAPLFDLREPESLWVPLDPRWQDGEKLAGRIGELAELVEGGRVERAELRRKLDEAIKQIPDGLGLTDSASKDALGAQVHAALGLAPGEAYEAEAVAQLELYRAVQQAAGDLDATRPGLHFTSADTQARFAQLHRAVIARLERLRDAFITETERKVFDALAKRKDLDPRADRYEYDYLGDGRKHYRHGIAQVFKDLKNLAAEKGRELETLNKSVVGASGKAKAGLEAEAAGLKQLVEQIKARRESIKLRVDDILGRIKALEEGD